MDIRTLTEGFIYVRAFFCYNFSMDKFRFPRIQRTAFTVASALEKSDEKAYWLSKTPHERLEAVELMRQMIYGYDPSTTRLQRVLEIAQRPQG